MAIINLKDFAATAPVLGDRNLPDNMAVVADNLDLRYKYLRPFSSVGGVVASLSPSDSRAFRIVGDDNTEKWFAFPEKHVDLFKGPVIDDSFERYYWVTPGKTSAEFLKVGSYANINTDESTMVYWNGTAGDYYRVGVPKPRDGMTVSAGAGSAPNETRFYTYTFINNFNEEGPPATPVSVTGPGDATFTLSSIDSWFGHPDGAGRNVVTVRIYRTVPSVSGETQFFKVGDITVGTTSYNDNSSDSVVASSVVLPSTYWLPPPDALDGFVVAQNGFVVAWKGRDIFVSEAYRPHAFPPQYKKSVDYDIVGAGVFGDFIVLCTDGAPYLLSGASSSSLTMTKFDTVEPCLFKRSVVTMGFGVLYASPNGIVLASSNGVKVLTSKIITSNVWSNYVSGDFFAVKYFDRYLAFYSPTRAIVFDVSDPERGFSSITSVRDVLGLEVDGYNNNVYIISDSSVFELGAGSVRDVASWKSKVFNFGSPENLAALQVDFDASSLAPEVDTALTSDEQAFNAFIYSAAYAAPFGGGVFGDYFEPPGNTTGVSSYLIPFGADQTFQEKYKAKTGGFLRVNVITPNETIQYNIKDAGVRKLVSGSKHANWQFEIVTNVDVYELAVGTSARELKRV